MKKKLELQLTELEMKSFIVEDKAMKLKGGGPYTSRKNCPDTYVPLCV